MNKLYGIVLLGFSLHASDQGGKLPDDFKFKAASEERRTSFMSQWNDYVKEDKTSETEKVAPKEESATKSKDEKKS